jgi:hypothetical protein
MTVDQLASCQGALARLIYLAIQSCSTHFLNSQPTSQLTDKNSETHMIMPSTIMLYIAAPMQHSAATIIIPTKRSGGSAI